MKHTICCIDDKIPASSFPAYFDETKILDGQVINYLLNAADTEWEDSVVKELFTRLLKDEKNEWSVTAFTAPSFYENYNSEVVFSPDVIVFDWDYNNVGGSDSSESLLKILQNSYSIVFILSGADNIDAIKQVLDDVPFKRFSNRFEVIPKEPGASVDSILRSFKVREESLFTYGYGFDIVRKSNKAINSILSDLSTLSVQGLVSSIGERDAQGYVATSEDFIDAMIPRFRRAMFGIEQKSFHVKQADANAGIDEIKDVWRYRLYDDTNSEMVSMGDIVHCETEDKYFIVFSSDCHMRDFWRKNGGYVSLIPLLRADEQKTKELVKRISPKSLTISSLTNCQGPFTILPAVPIKGSPVDFVAFPKGITSISIDKLDKNQENILKYPVWPGFTKVASLLDPFKSPLLQFLLDKITGYGCPDFHQDLQTYIANAVK